MQDEKMWDENGIVFYCSSFRVKSSAQSLASLMNAFSQNGKNVHLITYSQPSGDDYISNKSVKRYFLNYYENQGYSLANSFYKVLGELPVKTVVFCGRTDEKFFELFRAAQKLGRCIVLWLDSSPLISLAGGSEKKHMETLYMLHNADSVISNSKQDCETAEAMGAKNCIYMPFYYPYFDEEVGEADVSGRRIVFYTTYAGRNTRNIISAFIRLHTKYPDATLKIVVYKGVRQSGVLFKLIEDIEASHLSDIITIENKVLKPLRALREADISMTYAHLNTMPETAMESICAGIPAIVLRDADYSQDDGPEIKINASDIDGIEKALEYFMDEENRHKFTKEARAHLDPEYRAKQAEFWLHALDKIENTYDADVNASYEKYIQLADRVKECLSKKMKVADIRKEMFLDRISVEDSFAALVENNISVGEILSSYEEADLFAGADLKRVKNDMAQWHNIKNSKQSAETCKNKMKGKSVLPSDAIINLSVCGVACDEICECIPQIKTDKYAVTRVLSNVMTICSDITDTHSPEAELSDDFTGRNPNFVNLMNGVKLFTFENSKLFRFAHMKSVKRAVKRLEWYTTPFAEMTPWGKLMALPLRFFDTMKKKIQAKGKKRLAKEKIVEIDPGDIRKIQLMVLQIAIDFDKICRKHNLRYYLAGGTILGGIRHKGFIPWDDDMDITMPRPDYEKFLKIAKTELPEEYVMDQDCKPFFHNRIEYKDSHFDTYWRKGGIFLDILALEGCPDDDNLRLQHERKCKFWRTAMLEQARRMPVLVFKKANLKNYVKRLICKMTPRWFIKWRWHSWATKYDCNETSTWVCLPASIYTYEQERFPVEYWGEPVMMEFEGHMWPTMSHWEDYLICHFGNYMKMPPETLRKSHHFVYRYDLGKYKNMSVEEIEKQVFSKYEEEN